MIKGKGGFTIVELLVVIVVIAILASVTVVAYNGIQGNARLSVMKSALGQVNKAVRLFYIDKGYYPYNMTSNKYSIADSSSVLNISGLIPTYIATMPSIPNDGKGGYYAYLWSTNGQDYKLIRAVPVAPLPPIEQSVPNLDPNRSDRAWGYWSSNGASL